MAPFVRELATGLGLPRPPEIRTGADATQRTHSHGARAIQQGGRIDLDPTVTADSPEDRQLVAHEVVHAAQTTLPGRSPAPSAVETEGEAWQMATSLAESAPTRRPTLPLSHDTVAAGHQDGKRNLWIYDKEDQAWVKGDHGQAVQVLEEAQSPSGAPIVKDPRWVAVGTPVQVTRDELPGYRFWIQVTDDFEGLKGLEGVLPGAWLSTAALPRKPTKAPPKAAPKPPSKAPAPQAPQAPAPAAPSPLAARLAALVNENPDDFLAISDQVAELAPSLQALEAAVLALPFVENEMLTTLASVEAPAPETALLRVAVVLANHRKEDPLPPSLPDDIASLPFPDQAWAECRVQEYTTADPSEDAPAATPQAPAGDPAARFAARLKERTLATLEANLASVGTFEKDILSPADVSARLGPAVDLMPMDRKLTAAIAENNPILERLQEEADAIRQAPAPEESGPDQGASGSAPATAGSQRERLAELEDQIPAYAERKESLYRIRAAMRMDFPILGFLDASSAALIKDSPGTGGAPPTGAGEEGGSPVNEAYTEKVRKAVFEKATETIQTAIQMVQDGDIGLSSLSRMITEVRTELGVDAPGNEASRDAVDRWLEAERARDERIKVVLQGISLVLGLASLVGGPAAVVMGLLGAASGMGAAVMELDEAVELDTLTQADVGGEMVEVGDAEKAYYTALTDLVLSGVDLVTSLNQVRALGRMKGPRYMKRVTGAELETPATRSPADAGAPTQGAANGTRPTTVVGDAADLATDASKTARKPILNPGTKLGSNELTNLHGVPPKTRSAISKVSAKHEVIPDVRPSNAYSSRFHAHAPEGPATWRGMRAVPKMEEVKAKTINDLDVALGADPSARGLVGYFQPIKPTRAPGMSDAGWAKLMERYQMRLEEFLDPEMAEKMASKSVKVEDGVVMYGSAEKGFKPVAGDLDLYEVRDAVTGEPIRGKRLEKYISDLQSAGVPVEHKPHMEWEPKSALDNKIFEDIRQKHLSTSEKPEPLLRFQSDGSVEVAYADSLPTEWAARDIQAAPPTRLLHPPEEERK